MKEISFVNVIKDCQGYTPLSNISLKLECGGFYGIFGRENSGKTTVISLLSGRIFPDTGSILADGQPISSDDKLLRLICCSSEICAYPKLMKASAVMDAMNHLCPAYDLDYAYRLMNEFKLSPDTRVKDMTEAKKPLFSAINALAANAELTCLDEPAKGLSEEDRRRFYRLLSKKYEADKKTICLATHFVREAADIITHVIMLNSGRLICCVPVEFFRKNGYTVKGKRGLVEDFVSNKKTFGSIMNGQNKTAFVLGVRPINSPRNLSFGKLDLEVVFSEMTGTTDEEGSEG